MTAPPNSPGRERVRPATRADAPAVRALQSLLSEPTPRLLAVGLTAGDVLVSTAPTAGLERDAPSDGSAYAPVGYLLPIGGGGAGGDTDEGATDALDSDVPDGGAVHVAELAVAPARRREGRASELLRALCRRLPPDARVTLTVESSNRAARACYESVGFEATDRWADYFESGPAVVYERRAGAGDGEN